MRFILIAALKDVRRRLGDPASLVIWVGVPLLLTGLMNLVTGGGDQVAPRARVLLVDQDDTTVSALLTSAAGRGDFVDLETVTLDEGRRRIDAGEGSALVIIPRGFQDAVLQQTPAEITLVTNPAERILPQIVREALEIAVEGVFYVQQLFGPQLRRIGGDTTAGPPADADVASIAVTINQQLATLDTVLFPPVIRLIVAAREEASAGPSLSFGQLFLPGMLFMSFLFVASGMSGDIWEEQRLGTLRKGLTTPQSAHALLAGKLVAGMAMMTAVGLIALIGATALFDLAWMRLPAALVWCAFAGGALLALLTLLQTFASGQRAADMLMTMMIFPLMMLGGSFFPFESMPGWMAAVGRWTPNGLGVVILKDLLYGAPPLSTVAVAAAGIGIPAVAAFFLAGRRLRGKFATA
jgi:ABC-type multidrug transport system permease subunit